MQQQQIEEYMSSLQATANTTKVDVESDPLVEEFIDSLFLDGAWECMKNIILPTVGEFSKIFIPSYILPEGDLISQLQKVVDNEYQYFDKVISSVLTQYNGISNPEKINNYLKSLMVKKVFSEDREKFIFCGNCDAMTISDHQFVNPSQPACWNCNSHVWVVHPVRLPFLVRQCLSNNHFLELYTKAALKKSGFKLIARDFNGKRVCTSIQWHIFPRPVELDVCAVKGNNLIVCECKTNKITFNTIDQKVAQVSYLLSSFEKSKGEKPDIDLYFITTSEVEGNIPLTDYSTSSNLRIHFISRKDIPLLESKLAEDISKLAG